ncbi:MAG TPA: adenylate/guanylate cyclase domain-containing protein, partial [Actinomycetota bacterium]|nr:adenylate/guanylate cyclase domain-containing protein [Actinomycetota bacterium]
GLHTGECERIDDDDIGGTTVNIAARVMALAGPGDVLVSGTLRDLVIGSGIEFVDRGAHSLRGIPGEWRVFAVRAGETQEVGVPPVELMNASDRAIMRLGQRAPRAARALARLSGWAGPRGRKPTT